MQVRQASAGDVQRVCASLSAHCRREVFACRPHESGLQLVAELDGWSDVLIRQALLSTEDGAPAALFHAFLVTPGVAVLGMLTTDHWLTVSTAAYRWFHREVIPFWLMPNVHLAETAVLEDGPDREWLRRLGLVECLPALPRGKNGERFLTVAWIRPQGIGSGDLQQENG